MNMIKVARVRFDIDEESPEISIIQEYVTRPVFEHIKSDLKHLENYVNQIGQNNNIGFGMCMPDEMPKAIRSYVLEHWNESFPIKRDFFEACVKIALDLEFSVSE